MELYVAAVRSGLVGFCLKITSFVDKKDAEKFQDLSLILSNFEAAKAAGKCSNSCSNFLFLFLVKIVSNAKYV